MGWRGGGGGSVSLKYIGDPKDYCTDEKSKWQRKANDYNTRAFNFLVSYQTQTF